MKRLFKNIFMVMLLSLMIMLGNHAYAATTYTLEEIDYTGDYAFRFTSDKYVEYNSELGTGYTYLLSTHHFTLNGVLAFV